MAETIKDSVNSAYTTAKRALSSAPPTDAYLAWDSPGVENIQPDEEVKTAQIQDIVSRMQKRNFAKHRHAFTGTHVKTQGIVKGKLKVREDLPKHLCQGIFADPGKIYDVAARYANEPIFIQPDQESGPRGLSLKVFGVQGPRLEDVQNTATTQDFFFNNAPSIELTDIDTTLEIMSLREKYFDDPTTLGLKLKMRADAVKQHAIYMLPNTHIISHCLYTQSAFRFGKYYGKLAMFPISEEQRQSVDTVKKSDPEGVLSDWLFDYFQGKEARYEIKIQLGTSSLHHPTEDASIVWDEQTAPFQTLGEVHFPPQDSFNQARRVFWEDRLALSPWRGLADHRPLGSINRLRKGVYHNSKEQRDVLNASESKDVQSIDEIP